MAITVSSPSYPISPLLRSRFQQTFTITLNPSTLSRTHVCCVSATPREPLYTSLSNPVQIQSSPLAYLQPYLLSEWQLILKGWLCSAASVYFLSLTVPSIALLPRVLCESTGPQRPIREGLRLAVLAAARFATAYLQHAFLLEASLRAANRIRVRVFDRVVHNDLGFFEGNGGVFTGDVAHRITSEAADVADMAFALLNTVVPTALQLVAMSTQMVAVSPLLSLVSFLAIPCMSFIMAYLGKRLREVSKESHFSIARLSTYLNEVLPSMLAVKANNGEKKESSTFQSLAHEAMRDILRKKKMKEFVPHAMKLVYIGGLAALCAGFLVISGESFDGTKILSFSTALALVINPIQDVGKAYNELKQGEPAVERLFDLMRFESKVMENTNAIEVEHVRGDIKFCGVKFRYGDETSPPVLDGADLHIRPGETVALVGPSGGGKTTLAKLLLRLYDPLCGSILLDDCNIQDMRLGSLRNHVALVLQDAMLFSGTVAKNIAYRAPNEEINMAQVENAARIANAHEFIKDLPKGYETNIGPRGSLFSGGQKQRIAIARALYQNSSVLVLDEATSALDSRSELLVRQALERLMANRTVLVIAHRIETIKMADRVVVLEGGKFREADKSTLFGANGLLESTEQSSIVVYIKSQLLTPFG
ncbi:Lipid A export ATP-binding/permease protein MsbA [Rhynchospora pubera]|uniref:Lipid A export ATP-binding/permease protein MsbA n=1 Tax=Rhynchospora pubera TaxID=906938 RepID=A0AAV8DA30_9POAL|nr:Lipid A export ATP-binding/permease protein MsbA [Rhynchospora pubera]